MKLKLKDILQNTRPVLFKIVKVTQNKGSVRNCHSQEYAKEAWQPNVMWDPDGILEEEKGE